jgi:heme-degrading monooxygenase HmoA
LADEMSRIAASMEGFIDQKFYVAPDGERVTIVRFRDDASQRAWARHPEHLRAQQRGRDEFYSWFDISVAEESRTRTFLLE